jgi:7,8-dihydropterin-6-yl-methyl-4-(beta-D-ribofuranosyl)aminobenzene 5'-phosphate synthase
LEDFSHVLILVIKENDGVVIISGCSHNGVLNGISTVNNAFDGLPIKAFIGGLHLIGFPLLNTMAGTKNEIRELGRKILAYPIEQVYSGHCTGEKAYFVLSDVMGEKLKQMHTGTIIETW